MGQTSTTNSNVRTDREYHPWQIAEAAYTPLESDALPDDTGVYELYAECLHCHQHSRLNVTRIAERIGWDTPLTAIHAALRCSECGSHGAEIRMIATGQRSRH